MNSVRVALDISRAYGEVGWRKERGLPSLIRVIIYLAK
jgi:hypothetical protein